MDPEAQRSDRLRSSGTTLSGKSLSEIRSLIHRHAGPGTISSAQTSIVGLRVTAARVMTEPAHQMYEPMFGLVAQGTKSMLLGDAEEP
jgi:AraC-type transcriptional regulator N-terminus